MKDAWRDRGYEEQWSDTPRVHHADPFIGPTNAQVEYNVLIHTSDPVGKTPPSSAIYTKHEMSIRIAEHTVSVLRTAKLDTTKRRNRSVLSSGTLQLMRFGDIHESGITPSFYNHSSGTRAYDPLMVRTAGDIALVPNATATAIFKCPIPRCRQTFSLTATLLDLFLHLEDPVHWMHVDRHGLRCMFDCGGGFINETCLYRHILERRSPPTPGLTGGSNACPPLASGIITNGYLPWNNLNLASVHWSENHATAPHRSGVRTHSCRSCKAVFASQDMLVAHFYPLAGSKDGCLCTWRAFRLQTDFYSIA